MSGGLTNFATKLDWAAFGAPDGAVHTGLWTNSMGGYNVTVSTEGGDPSEGMRTAYVFDAVKVNGVWTDPGFAPFVTPYAFPGHFNSITDSQPASPAAPDSPYGDHLMGFRGDGSTVADPLTKSLIIDFGTSLENLGFRLAANSNFSFNATVQFFTGANGGGNSLGSYTFNGLTNGGVCSTLSINAANPPVPCNNAQFIAALGVNARSVKIASNDVDGFWVSDIYTRTPEPTPMVFAGCGLALLYLGRKKLRRS